MTKADNYGWSDDQVAKLRQFAGKLFYTEIAKKIGKRPASVHYKARKLGLPNTRETLRHRFAEWNRKHAHLGLPALKYYQTHSAEETAERFSLAAGEFKSLLTAAYKRKDWKRWRKESRTHEAWSAKELQFLLQHAGLRPRKWIMGKLKRGTNVCHIKERMQALGIASRNLQGLTLSQFIQAFGKRPAFYLLTDAGPNATSGHHKRAATNWRIVPWVWLEKEISAGRLKTALELRMLIKTHAQFQDWIFEGHALKKMKRIVEAVK